MNLGYTEVTGKLQVIHKSKGCSYPDTLTHPIHTYTPYTLIPLVTFFSPGTFVLVLSTLPFLLCLLYLT